MKTNKIYETPTLEHLDLYAEGVLCASGLENNSIPDLKEDNLNW